MTVRILIVIAVIMAVAYVATAGTAAACSKRVIVTYEDGSAVSCKRVVRKGNVYLVGCFKVRSSDR